MATTISISIVCPSTTSVKLIRLIQSRLRSVAGVSLAHCYCLLLLLLTHVFSCSSSAYQEPRTPITPYKPSNTIHKYIHIEEAPAVEKEPGTQKPGPMKQAPTARPVPPLKVHVSDGSSYHLHDDRTQRI